MKQTRLSDLEPWDCTEHRETEVLLLDTKLHTPDQLDCLPHDPVELDELNRRIQAIRCRSILQQASQADTLVAGLQTAQDCAGVCWFAPGHVPSPEQSFAVRVCAFMGCHVGSRTGAGAWQRQTHSAVCAKRVQPGLRICCCGHAAAATADSLSGCATAFVLIVIKRHKIAFLPLSRCHGMPAVSR